jgi:acetyl-CoA carboxylase biotin carboxyl carrier protein
MMAIGIEASVTGVVWKIEVAVGDSVGEGDDLIILESMKMEMPIVAASDCVVVEIRCEEGEAVEEGQVLLLVEDA